MARKKKVPLSESKLEVIKGMPDVDDILSWISEGNNTKVIVVLSCMTPLIGTGPTAEVFEVGVQFESIGIWTEGSNCWWGRLTIKDATYRSEKRRFCIDRSVQSTSISPRGVLRVPTEIEK